MSDTGTETGLGPSKVLALLARALIAVGRYGRALSLVERGLQHYPRSLHLIAALRGLCAIYTGEWDRYFGTFRSMIDLHPDKATVHWSLADALMKFSLSSEALIHLNHCLEHFGAGDDIAFLRGNTWARLAICHAKLQQWDEAMRALDRSSGAVEMDLDAVYARLLLMLGQGGAEMIPGYLESLAAVHPPAFPVFHWRAYMGSQYLDEGPKSLPWHELALRHTGQRAWREYSARYVSVSLDANPLEVLLEYVGHVVGYGDKRLAERAIAMRSIRFPGHSPSILYSKAFLRKSLGDLRGASEVCQKAVGRRNEPLWVAQFWGLLAEVRNAQGRSIEAREAALKSLGIFPYSNVAWGNLGTSHQQSKNWSEAIASYQRALSLDPFQPDHLTALCTCLIRARRWKQALHTAEELGRLKPVSPESWVLRSEALLGLGRVGEAHGAAEHAVSFAGLSQDQKSRASAVIATSPA